MTRHDLAVLDPEAALALLRARYPMLAPRVRQRLLDEAQGNPLALLELPPALSGPQRAAWQALPAVLPLTDRLQAVFAGRVSGLPGGPLASCCCWPSWRDPPTMRCSIRPSAASCWSAWPRPSGGLVRADDSTRQLVFRHPLTRSAIVGMSTAQEPREAHRRLADTLADQPDQRISHLGAATLAPDEEVAALLHDHARRILAAVIQPPRRSCWPAPRTSAPTRPIAAAASPKPHSSTARRACSWSGSRHCWRRSGKPRSVPAPNCMPWPPTPTSCSMATATSTRPTSVWWRPSMPRRRFRRE